MTLQDAVVLVVGLCVSCVGNWSDFENPPRVQVCGSPHTHTTLCRAPRVWAHVRCVCVAARGESSHNGVSEGSRARRSSHFGLSLRACAPVTDWSRAVRRTPSPYTCCGSLGTPLVDSINYKRCLICETKGTARGQTYKRGKM
eukprot:scaffold128693_cov68-Phaeocystis_antarctica.AAC.7